MIARFPKGLSGCIGGGPAGAALGAILLAGGLGGLALADGVAGVILPAGSLGGSAVLFGLVLHRALGRTGAVAAGGRDKLTGLADRAMLRATLGGALRRALRGEGFALICFDLDRLRSINETLGHGAGDAVLQEAARRLRRGVRDIDLVARLDGDEFAVLQARVGNAREAEALAGRLLGALGEPFRVGRSPVRIGCCAGIVLAGPGGVRAEADETGIDQLVGDAEIALGHAKRDGRGASCVFEPEWAVRARARSELETDLRPALERGEFELHYQPLVNVQGRRVAGCEALLRWRHPVRGLVPPAVFIPLAEEAGLIVEIGGWVLRAACAQAAEWPAPAYVAVNLSAVQVTSPGLVETVRAALATAGLPGSRLELEITESVLLDATDTVLDVLHRLRAMGVRIALDDFGTGYSSLSYLRSFPFDTLKIDRSFVSALDRPEESDAIIRAIVAMGASLGMSITAEGVETTEQLARLVALGCTDMQGHFFSTPRPACEVPHLLAAQAPSRAVA